MTRDDVILLAGDAGMRVEDGGWILCGPVGAPEMEMPALMRFAILVATSERERCAKICKAAGAAMAWSVASEILALRDE